MGYDPANEVPARSCWVCGEPIGSSPSMPTARGPRHVECPELAVGPLPAAKLRTFTGYVSREWLLAAQALRDRELKLLRWKQEAQSGRKTMMISGPGPAQPVTVSCVAMLHLLENELALVKVEMEKLGVRDE